MLGQPWKILKNEFGEDYELITQKDAKSIALIYSTLQGYSLLRENWLIVDSTGVEFPIWED